MLSNPRPILKPTLDPTLFRVSGTGHAACYPSPRSALPSNWPPSRCSTPASAGSVRRSPSPHVHFPPTPTLASMIGTTHSASLYDRAPILVPPNTCALPARGERVYRDRDRDASPTPLSSMRNCPSCRPRPVLRPQTCLPTYAAVVAGEGTQNARTATKFQALYLDTENASCPSAGNSDVHAFHYHHPLPTQHAATITVAWRRFGRYGDVAGGEDSDLNCDRERGRRVQHDCVTPVRSRLRRWDSWTSADSETDNDFAESVDRSNTSVKQAGSGLAGTDGGDFGAASSDDLSLDGCLGGF